MKADRRAQSARPQGMSLANSLREAKGGACPPFLRSSANTYLDACDHHALETLRVGGYLRYMDDVLIFDRSPQMLNEQVGSLATWLKDQRALAVKTERLLVGACRTGVPFLGWRVFPGFIRLQPERRKGSRGLLRRREREFRAGTISAEKLTESVQAIVAGVRAVRPGFRFDRWGFPGLES